MCEFRDVHRKRQIMVLNLGEDTTLTNRWKRWTYGKTKTYGEKRSTRIFLIMRCEFREMGTPEARNLISVRCDFTIYLFLEGGEK